MGGYDPYSSSKGCAELVTSAYGRSYFMPQMGLGSIASVRAGNVVGGGDWAKDRLMADLMRGLMAGRRRRHPQAARRAPLAARARAAFRLSCGGANISARAARLPGKPGISGLTWAATRRWRPWRVRFAANWGRPEAMKIREDADAPHEAGLLTLDSTKAQDRAGLAPALGFRGMYRPDGGMVSCASRGAPICVP